MNLVLRPGSSAPGSGEVEVVERKGLGHPDSICDGVAESICVALCRQYLERFGQVLHHNVDKVLLVGGTAHARFGGGECDDPIELYLAGRATSLFDGEAIPVHDIAIDACRAWLRRHLPWLDVERNVRIISRLRQGSIDLVRLFTREAAVPLANDTSYGVGFAPFTDLERVVLEVERHLNAAVTQRSHPEIGQDIKVMGVRRNEQIRLTVACAFVSRFVEDVEDYTAKKRSVRDLVLNAASRVTSLGLEAIVNAADDLAGGDVFLTVTGTSAEAGDDGQVGRGNRTSGLITPYRLMTLEAAAGKNPVTHVGKIYSLLAAKLASALVSRIPGVGGADCVLVGEIGAPVDNPGLIDLRLGPKDLRITPELKTSVLEVTRGELAHLSDLRDAVISREVAVF